MMEHWVKSELDELTEGEIAIRLFKAQEELSTVEQQRADASMRLSAIRTELERAEVEYRDACADEREYLKELNDLRKYLADRLSNNCKDE